jgi:dTDP-4-amino-4,6-dideoxygalactose transaminase
VIRTAERSELQAHLASAGIETLVHYPLPIPQQPAFAALPPTECPVASRACSEVLSLPLHPRLTNQDVGIVAAAISEWAAGRKPCEP